MSPLRCWLVVLLAGELCRAGCHDGTRDVSDVSFEKFVDDLETVVDALELERFALLGISQGCAVSVAYAHRHPERVRGLVISNGPFHRDYRWHGWARVWQTPVLGELASMPIPAFVFRREMRRGDPALPADYPDRAHAEMHAAARRTVLRTYRAWADFEAGVGVWEERLLEATARIPTRVLWGERDPFIPGTFETPFIHGPVSWPTFVHES